jgi:hypothetical protein
MTENTTVEERTHAGIRVGAHGTRAHAWLDPRAGNCGSPEPGSTPAVGSLYPVNVTRGGAVIAGSRAADVLSAGQVPPVGIGLLKDHFQALDGDLVQPTGQTLAAYC